jgi:hypothetical protein
VKCLATNRGKWAPGIPEGGYTKILGKRTSRQTLAMQVIDFITTKGFQRRQTQVKHMPSQTSLYQGVADAVSDVAGIFVLPPFDGVVSTRITGVDYKTGMTVGSYTDVYGHAHGWRWTGRGRKAPTVLGAPPSDERQGLFLRHTARIPMTVPGLAVNDAGAVVDRCDENFAWSWKDGIVTLIEPPFETCEFYRFEATGINNRGVIVGSCADSGYISDHGVVTVFNGSLGQPPPAYIYPKGINDKGTVGVGVACEDFDEFLEGECAGFPLKKGVMSFVSYPGAQVTEIRAAHPTSGQIWGNWQDRAGVWHAFTAAPAPAPARASEEVASR